MKKSIFFILIFALVLLFALCSCGGNTDTSSDTANTTDTSSDTNQDTEIDTDTCKHTNIIIDETVYATCVSEGLSSGKHCGDCGKILEEQTVIPKTEHFATDGGYKEPTCAEPGYSGGVYCGFCSLEIIKGDIIPALEHTEVSISGYPATCSKTGLTDGKYCTVCENQTVKQMVIDKLSHTEFVTPAKAPTCQNVGYTEKRQCTVCKEITLESEEIAKTGHTVVIDKAVSATCSQTGLTEGSHCSVCNEVIKQQQTVNKNSNNHVYGDFITVTKSPTTSATGTGTNTCTKCGKTETVTLSKLSYSTLTKDDIYSIETDQYNPAYDNRWKVIDGNKNVSSIYSAGDWFGNVGDILVITFNQEMILSDLKVYTAGNFTFATVRVKDSKGNVTLEKSIKAEGSANGGTPQTHTVASGKSIKAYTVEIEITSLKWNDAKTLKVSEVEIKAAKQDTRIEHTHSYRELVENVRKATCQTKGLDLYECFCGKQQTIETPKGDHEYNILSANKYVSCEYDGYSTYRCVCGDSITKELPATGHVYYKLIEYSVVPTVSTYGKATFKCNTCSFEEEKSIAPLALEEINYLRVEKIENGKITLTFNIYGDRPNYDIRYSQSEITEENFITSSTINATVDGTRKITVTFSIDVGLDKCYYVALRPYMGDNYGKIVTIRIGGNELIPIDYHSGNVYSGELLNSFAKLFDEQVADRTVIPVSQLPRLITDTSDSVLYNMDLSPIVDLEYLHYVSSTYLYYDKTGVSVTVRWSDTPVDAYAENAKWDGYYTFKSKEGWNEIKIDSTTRYIQIIFQDGSAPYEMLVYGYQCGDGDEIAEEKTTLPTMGEMMGMCGFVASGGGNTPIDSVICTTVLREYHNFGWTYTLTAYPNKAAFFNSNPNWMGNFDAQYIAYRNAGINVIPCVQWDLVNVPQSNQVDSNNLPIKSNGKFVKGSFWDKMNPHTYFMYADSMFAFSARYGSNNSLDLLNVLALHVSDTNKVGLNCLEWIELGNEPEGAWNGIHNYYSAYQLAALTSAAYDGHCRTMVSSMTSSGYHLGLKNADPNMKGAMAGVSAVSNEYITAMCYWMKANRLDGKVAFDAFNVHCYMTKNIELPNGQSTSVGVSPEEAGIVNTLSQLISIRNKYYPEKEVWITEFGWDTNQSYATSTSSHAYSNEETGVSYTGKEVQAMWLTRTYLLLSAIGIDKATMYMCEDCGVEEISVGKYGTAGVIGYMYDENGDTVEFKKDSYYYLYTLKNTLGDYTFDSQVEAYDNNVYIYKYKTTDGKTAYAVWCGTSDGTVVKNYQLGVNSDRATLVEVEYGDIDGVQTNLIADEYGYISIDVTEVPIYIVVD